MFRLPRVASEPLRVLLLSLVKLKSVIWICAWHLKNKKYVDVQFGIWRLESSSVGSVRGERMLLAAHCSIHHLARMRATSSTSEGVSSRPCTTSKENSPAFFFTPLLPILPTMPFLPLVLPPVPGVSRAQGTDETLHFDMIIQRNTTRQPNPRNRAPSSTYFLGC